MSDSQTERANQHVPLLRSHVLCPVRTTTELLAEERAAVVAETELFEAFGATVGEFQPVTPERRGPQSVMTQSADHSVESVLRAYERTVFSGDPYQRRGGESLSENLADEFGHDVATLLCADGTRFTAELKSAVLRCTEQCIRDRDRLRGRLEAEERALAGATAQLSELLDPLDSVKIPSWYAREFEREIDELCTDRQSRLQANRSQFDRHSFYEYLTAGQPWTYPVLTAIARLREAIFFGQ